MKYCIEVGGEELNLNRSWASCRFWVMYKYTGLGEQGCGVPVDVDCGAEGSIETSLQCLDLRFLRDISEIEQEVREDA